jgi:hypothetical protein
MMNKFESLNKIIEQTIEEYDEQIVEVTTLDQLYELSAVGSIAGPAGVSDEKQRRLEEMNSREEIVTERLMRQYIRNKIKENLSKQENKQTQEEQSLRRIIRLLLKEGDISDVHPHRSTGINTLEDVLKKAIPTLRMDFKRLTTDKKQRDSFRAHIIKAVEDSLAPMKANDSFLQGGATGEPSSLLDEPLASEEPEDDDFELPELEEANIEVDVEPEMIPVDDDDKPSEEEEFGSGLEDRDETGRNMAFTSYKKVSQYILDAYDSLANPKDKEVFREYLVTNLKLYFDKFEDELQNTVEEPDSPSYEKA